MNLLGVPRFEKEVFFGILWFDIRRGFKSAQILSN